MTVFIGVDGAVQHGLSMTGILLILILFTSYFLLMFVYSHFRAALQNALLVIGTYRAFHKRVCRCENGCGLTGA